MSDIKILFVNDSSHILEVGGPFFERTCFEILKTENSKAASGFISEDRPNLMIMDLTMPDSCGQTSLEVIKTGQSIPTIVVCNDGDEEMMEQIAEAGCKNILTKPLNSNRLIAEIIRHLNVVDRKYERILCDFEVIYHANGKDSWSMVNDISQEGMRILCEEPLPTGTSIDLRFRLTDDSDLIEVPGVVRASLSNVGENEFGFTKGMGIQFTDPPEKVKNLIQNYAEMKKTA